MSPEMQKEIFSNAGEYVLGTLEGEELRQFQSLRVQPDTIQALGFWEDRLGAWSLASAPVDPPHRVWNAIEFKIDEREASGGLIRNFWADIRFWRPLAMAAVAAALVLFFFYPEPVELPIPEAPLLVAMLGAADQPAQFLLAAYPGERKAMVRVLRPMDMPADKSLELWVVPGEGKVPISCGLLPNTGEMQMPLTEKEMPLLKIGAVLAVSMEPRGGSPIEGPSGPVLYQGQLQKI